MSTGWPQRIIAITELARGGPGKDYAAKLHDCGAITDGPPFSGLCSLLDGPLTCGVAVLMVVQPCRQSTVLAGGGRATHVLRTSRACRVGFEQSDCNTNQDLTRCHRDARPLHRPATPMPRRRRRGQCETMTMAMLRDDDRKHRESRMALLLAIAVQRLASQ